MKSRCDWVTNDPLYLDYHDHEWGVPLHDEQRLFEFLLLEGAQAGLSWITVLKKRQHYRQLFDNFDPEKIARYPDRTLEKHLKNPLIIRNRLKVYSFRKNAIAWLALKEQVPDISAYLWSFVDNQTIQNSWPTLDTVPNTSKEAKALAKELKKQGFTFVGPTICYAFMQATGMVNDHLISCFCHPNH